MNFDASARNSFVNGIGYRGNSFCYVIAAVSANVSLNEDNDHGAQTTDTRWGPFISLSVLLTSMCTTERGGPVFPSTSYEKKDRLCLADSSCKQSDWTGVGSLSSTPLPGENH